MGPGSPEVAPASMRYALSGAGTGSPGMSALLADGPADLDAVLNGGKGLNGHGANGNGHRSVLSPLWVAGDRWSPRLTDWTFDLGGRDGLGDHRLDDATEKLLRDNEDSDEGAETSLLTALRDDWVVIED